MNILITSIIDVEWTPNSRLHQFIKHLSYNHSIYLIEINDSWKSKNIKANIKNTDFNKYLDNITIFKFTEKDIPPVKQELFSWRLLSKIQKDIPFKDIDVHLNYNSLLSGRYIAKKIEKYGINTVYDIADNLPEMISKTSQSSIIAAKAGWFIGKVMIKKNIKQAKYVTFITPSLKKNVSIPDEKAVFIPNGVDTSLFKKMKLNQNIINSYDLKDNFVLGFVGALREWVDFKPVFQAIKKLNEQSYNVKLLIVGEEDKINDIKSLTYKYKVNDDVVFTGAIPYHNLPMYMNCMDACLIPFSKDLIGQDSLPLKLFEYMACEKPVISTSLDGVYQAVGNRTIYASNSDQYIEKIRFLHDSPDEKDKLGKIGRKFTLDNFSWDNIMKDFEKTLEAAA